MEDTIEGKPVQISTKGELCKADDTISLDSKCDASINGKRKRRSTSQLIICPVCGLSLRSGEIKEHYEKELNRVDDLSDPTSKSSVRMVKRMASSQNKKGKKSNEALKEGENEADADTQPENAAKRLKDFGLVKDNRRQRYAQTLVKQIFASGANLNDSSGYHLLKCPVCETPIEGSEEELVTHVQRCLKKKEGDLDTDEESDSESLDEYTWAGQTRVRVTSLLEPGMYVCDGDPIKLQMTNEDEELDIECDEQTLYGQAQYSEKDVIPCCSDNPGENEAMGRIRAAISSDQASTPSSESARCRWNDNNDTNTNEDEKSTDLYGYTSNVDSAAEIKALKSRINCLNDELQKERLKCLVCMEGFNTPLVSVLCWHVYCEECWLRTLGAKKLCPQCNTITSPADLRKIYI